ncbi:MAG: penicillin-binding protein 2 [Alphaproteobacteria bacterium]|nr:penicillin-binding protein 2 [Alphaproteobacteria bacterium]
MYEIGHNLYSRTYRALMIAKKRTFVVISVFIFAFLVLIVRLAHVMIFNKNDDENSLYANAPTIAFRADIVDRHNNIIATSLPTVSLYACPHEMIDFDEAAEKTCAVFKDIEKEKFLHRLKKSKKFLWVKRNLSPTQEQEILNQGIPGFHFLKTEKRVYPDKNLLSHVIGGTDIDNNGIAGIEKVFDEALKSSTQSIALSIDLNIQHAVHDELQKAIDEFRAKGGAAIVMKIKTGEIFSLVSLPDFDPNRNENPNSRERFNMATSSAIEPGSSAKIINTAMALETKKITPFSQYDARFPIKIGRFTIHDFHGRGTHLSVEEILKYSSNIGSAKIALDVGRKYQKEFFKKIGLLDTVTCELVETQKPLYPKNWGEVNSMTIAFGHGIALSPLHLITVVSGMLNGGMKNNPTLLKKNSAPSGEKIISEKTAKQIAILMRLNVTEGANKRAEVKGYCVGGKSGTAEKLNRGKYSKTANYTGFIGAFPMPNPEYSVYVVLDEPQATKKTHGYRTAGWIAAPTAANIIQRIGPMLNVTTSGNREPNWHEMLRKIK